jgi:hypothetical protein
LPIVVAVRRDLLPATLCCAAYAVLVYWFARSSSGAIAYLAWGTVPLAILLVTAALSEGALRKRLILLLYALAAVGVGLLVHAWWIGNAIVLVGLPIVLFVFVGVGLAAVVLYDWRTRRPRS